MKRAFHAWHCSVWVMLWILSSCCNYFCSTCLLWEFLFSYSSDTSWCMLIFPHSGYLRRVVIFFWQSNSIPFKNGRTPNSLWFYSIPFSLIMLVDPTSCSPLRCKIDVPILSFFLSTREKTDRFSSILFCCWNQGSKSW
jgi:hypothetical protein